MENRHIPEFKQGDIITRVAEATILASKLVPVGMPVEFICIANGYIFLYNVIDENVVKIHSHYTANTNGWDYYIDTSKIVDEYLQKCAATEQPPAPESDPEPAPKFDVIAYLKEIDAPTDTIVDLIKDGITECTPELMKYLMGTSLSACDIYKLVIKYFDATEQAELLAYYASVASAYNMTELITPIADLINRYPAARTPEMVKYWLSLNPSDGDIWHVIRELDETGVTVPCIHEIMNYYVNIVHPDNLCALMYKYPQTRVPAAFDWLKHQKLNYGTKYLICKMLLTSKTAMGNRHISEFKQGDVIAYLKEIDAPTDIKYRITECTPALMKYLMGTSLSACDIYKLVIKYFDATEQAELLAYYASVASAYNMTELITPIADLINRYPAARTPEMVKYWLSLNPSKDDICHVIRELDETGVTVPCIHEIMNYYVNIVHPYHLCVLMYKYPQTRVPAAFDWLKHQELDCGTKYLICKMLLTSKNEG